MTSALVAAIAVVVMLGFGPAQADDAFTRAVYCSAVMRGQVEASRRMISDLGSDRSLNPNQRQQAVRTTQQQEQKYTTDFQRLKAYVAANTRSGDVEQYVSFMVAMKRGERDIAQCEKEKQQTGRCVGTCIAAKCQSGDIPCLQTCDTQCGAATCARTDGCNDTSFLPN